MMLTKLLNLKIESAAKEPGGLPPTKGRRKCRFRFIFCGKKKQTGGIYFRRFSLKAAQSEKSIQV
jgi:hypothetical protein